jgi:hypothetical protein
MSYGNKYMQLKQIWDWVAAMMRRRPRIGAGVDVGGMVRRMLYIGRGRWGGVLSVGGVRIDIIMMGDSEPDPESVADLRLIECSLMEKFNCWIAKQASAQEWGRFKAEIGSLRPAQITYGESRVADVFLDVSSDIIERLSAGRIWRCVMRNGEFQELSFDGSGVIGLEDAE